MAKYCPKCYAGIGPDDAVCGNCGNVLKENTSGVEDFTAGVFDNENLSHDVSGKEIPGETPDEEILSHEIVADEIIADGIVEEEVTPRNHHNHYSRSCSDFIAISGFDSTSGFC